MEFDIQSKVENDIEDMFLINIIEKDSKNQEISNAEIAFGTYKGTKQVELITNENTTEIRIEFYAKDKYINKELTINSLKLNGKEYPLQYKYIPTKLVQKIKNININYKTSQERMEMIKNALELSKDNFLTGIGGDGWQYKYGEVQSYEYISKEIHSYPAKVILEFGIIGVISYIGIIILVVKCIKDRDTSNISLIFAVMIIILHSIIDTDMEYAHILIYVFAMIANISSNKEIKEKDNKKLYVILNIVLIALMLVSIYSLINIEQYDRYSNISDLLSQRNGLRRTSAEYLEINRKIAQEYEEIIKTERYGHIVMYENIVKYYINSDYDKKKEMLEEYYEKIKQYKNKNNNNSGSLCSKIYVIDSIINQLERQENPTCNEMAEKFADIIIEEYEVTKVELERCLEKQYVNDSMELIELEDIYNDAKDVKDKYIYGVRIYNTSETKIKDEDLQDIEIDIGQDMIIYHTHGTESYKSNEEYETFKFYRTTDTNYNVIKIGEHLSQLFEDKGYNIIHETEYFDLPSTSGAYGRAIARVNERIAENEETSLVIDIHRDAISEEEHLAPTVEIDGKTAARLRFVIGTETELEEEWKNNLKLALEIQRKADEIYPGLFQPILIREEGYQKDLSRNAILIEVGENCSMLEDALNSIEYFAEVVNMCATENLK